MNEKIQWQNQLPLKVDGSILGAEESGPAVKLHLIT